MSKVVYLVHGTWSRALPSGRSPRWFEDGSDFCRALGEALGDGVQIVTVPWSGLNRVGARDRAAEVLAERLVQNTRKHPLSTHVVVAHSHGGSAALLALKKVPADARPDGVATLSTPFVHVGRRVVNPFPWESTPYISVPGPYIDPKVLSPEARQSLLKFKLGPLIGPVQAPPDPWGEVVARVIAMVLTAAIAAVVLALGRWAHIGEGVEGGLVFLGLLLTWFVLSLVLGSGGFYDVPDRWSRWLEAKLEASRLPSAAEASPKMTRLLVLREVGDEATLGLAVAAVAARLNQILWWVFLPVLRLLEGVGEPSTRAPVFPQIYFAAYAVVALPLYLASAVLLTAFGLDLFPAGPALEVSAETTPPGLDVEVKLIAPPAGTRGLRHSVYANPEGRALLFAWIKSVRRPLESGP